ncbi:MAG: RHS repeat protein, partial [Ignavibacteria bacterium]|nr:RHS repeat protein [Ignavibacteria bacterium]
MKGIAVQTLNFENNFYLQTNNGGTQNLKGEETPLLIPGYSYTNNFLPLDEEPNIYDYIEILMADGSKRVLVNPNTFALNGTYYEMGKDYTGYAIVVPRESHFRKMWYKPGDGLTYYFEEEQVKFNGKMYSGQTNPKAMYLKWICSNYGDTLFLGYYERFQYGRKIFTNVAFQKANRTILTVDYTTYEYFGEQHLAAVKVTNRDNEEFLYALITQLAGSSGINDTNRSPNRAHTKIKYIHSISDNLNRTDVFIYDTTSRDFKYLSDFSFNQPVYLLYKTNYYNKRISEFSFFNKPFNSNQNYSPIDFGVASDRYGYCNTHNMNYAYRDNQTNFMLKERKSYNTFKNNTNLIFEEKFNYIYKNGSSLYDQRDTVATEIKTIITKYNRTTLKFSSPDTITTVKSFSRYRIAFRAYYQTDFNSIIKLERESINDGIYLIDNKYVWSKGWKNYTNAFTGHFWLDTLSESITRNNITRTKTTTFNYQYDSLLTLPEMFKHTKKQETKIDPQNLITSIEYFNFIPNLSQYLDTLFYFKLGDIKKERIYSGNLIKSQKENFYHLSGEFKGKLQREKIFSDIRETHKDFSYYSKNENYHFSGMLKNTRDDKNLIIKHYYPKPDTIKDLKFRDTVYSHWIKTDGSIELRASMHFGYQTKPFLTEYIIDTDTLRYFNSYYASEFTRFEVDANRNYSEFSYDKLNRIKKASLPESFLVGSLPQLDTTITHLLELKPTDKRFSVRNQNEISENHCFVMDEDLGGIEPERPTEASKWNYFTFLIDRMPSGNIDTIFNANLIFYTKSFETTPDQNRRVNIMGIKEPYQLNKKVYATSGSISFSFDPNSKMIIDIKNILNDLKLNGDTLYGFMFSTSLLMVSQNHEYKKFNFNCSSDSVPMLDISYTVQSIELSNSKGSILFDYNDFDNTITTTRRLNFSGKSPKSMITSDEYDSFGQQRKISIKNESLIFESKAETNYNYMGLKSELRDGESRKEFYKYNYFSNPIETSFIDTLITSPKQKFEYYYESGEIDGKQFFEWRKFYDEEQNTKETYFDKAGNIIAERQGSLPPTIFNYNRINQLISVKTPGGKYTYYEYDDFGNVKQKTATDDGTTKYKYDRFRNLRFTLNTGSPSSERGLIFNTYDLFNRPVLTGGIYSNYGFDQLNPDRNYNDSFEGEEGNYLTVRMYDKYQKTGVFAAMPDPINPDSIKSGNIKGRLTAIAFRDKVNESWNYKVFTYNHLGRVKNLWVKFGSNPWKRIINEYDHQGNLVKQTIENDFYFWYDYDIQGRLKEVRTNN